MLDLKYFKNKLEEEKKRLEAELKQVAKRSPEHPEDWEPIAVEAGLDARTSDPNELSDAFEEFQNRSAIGVHLEERLNEVLAALNRIGKGTFGTCEIGGEKMDAARLEANPAAANCIKHSKK